MDEPTKRAKMYLLTYLDLCAENATWPCGLVPHRSDVLDQVGLRLNEISQELLFDLATYVRAHLTGNLHEPPVREPDAVIAWVVFHDLQVLKGEQQEPRSAGYRELYPDRLQWVLTPPNRTIFTSTRVERILPPYRPKA